MPRIVAGSAKGRRLSVPPQGTRPTSDRAREALFNALATMLDLDGVRVLDLFAGSGAVGLEALSRGAAAATFVESHRGAVAVLRSNLTATGLAGADVVTRTVEAYLSGPVGDPFDVVFADPPYAYPDAAVADLLAALAGRHFLAADAVVVVERSARSPEPSWPAEPVVMQTIKHRRYGEGALWYGRPR
jgi:16S rRNA (guanine966-N2)-methyltransferase